MKQILVTVQIPLEVSENLTKDEIIDHVTSELWCSMLFDNNKDIISNEDCEVIKIKGLK